MRCSVFASAAGRFIAFRIFGLACWNGTSRYGSTLPSAISGIRSSTCGYGIHVVQAHPRAELAEAGGEIRDACGDIAAAPRRLLVFDVDAVRARVLRDHEQLAHAGAHEALRFAEHVGRGAADEVAAQARDDAEAAAVIAAFGDLQVRVVARRELDALRRHEIDERIVRRRDRRVHGRDDGFVLMRPRDREHVRVRVANDVRFGAEAARDDDAAVLGERFADRVERLGARAVQEPARVDDDDVGARVVGGRLVTLGAQLAQDSLGIDERLRAAEAHEADFGRMGFRSGFRHLRASKGGCDGAQGALLRHARRQKATRLYLWKAGRPQSLEGTDQGVAVRPRGAHGADGDATGAYGHGRPGARRLGLVPHRPRARRRVRRRHARPPVRPRRRRARAAPRRSAARSRTVF